MRQMPQEQKSRPSARIIASVRSSLKVGLCSVIHSDHARYASEQTSIASIPTQKRQFVRQKGEEYRPHPVSRLVPTLKRLRTNPMLLMET